MDLQEALEVLGLETGASRDEVEAVFKKAAKSAHPDSQDGDRERWDRVVEARGLLVGSSVSQALVPLDAVREIVKVQEKALVQADERAERVAASEVAVRSVVTRHTAPLARRKRMAWAAGAFAAGIGALITVFRAVDLRPGGEAGVNLAVAMIVLYVLAGLCGLAGLILRFRVERLEHVIEDVTGQLSQRSEFLRVLNEIRRESEVPLPWSRDTFDYALEEWEAVIGGVSSSVAATVESIGIEDFGEIFLSKGLELGVLTESTQEEDGELFASYELAIPRQPA